MNLRQMYAHQRSVLMDKSGGGGGGGTGKTVAELEAALKAQQADFSARMKKKDEDGDALKKRLDKIDKATAEDEKKKNAEKGDYEKNMITEKKRYDDLETETKKLREMKTGVEAQNSERWKVLLETVPEKMRDQFSKDLDDPANVQSNLDRYADAKKFGAFGDSNSDSNGSDIDTNNGNNGDNKKSTELGPAEGLAKGWE